MNFIDIDNIKQEPVENNSLPSNEYQSLPPVDMPVFPTPSNDITTFSSPPDDNKL